MSNKRLSSDLNNIFEVVTLTDEAAASCLGGFTMLILKDGKAPVKVRSGADGRISRSLPRDAVGVAFSKEVNSTVTFSNGDIGGSANSKRYFFRERPDRQATSIQVIG